MPQQLTIKDFSGGWSPSSDPLNIAKNAFPQLDNLYLNEQGALHNVGGQNTRRTYSYAPHSIFNTSVSGSDTLYACDTNGGIFREGTSIGTGGSTTQACFSTAFDFTLICSGSENLKDNGTSVANLGVGIPASNPTYTKIAYVTNSLGNPTLETIEDGGATLSASGGVLTFTDAQSFDGSTTFGLVQCIAYNNSGNTDQSTIFVPTTTLSAPINPDDTIGVTISKNVGDAFAYLDNVRAIALQIKDGNGVQSNYFWQATLANQGYGTQWPVINFVSQASVRLAVTRNDAAQGQPLDWTQINSIGIVIITDNSANYKFNVALDDHWTGGPWDATTDANGNGVEYMQVNVNNTGSYLAKSQAGPSTGFLYSNGFVYKVTPYITGIDAQVNAIWIFRRGNTVSDWRLVLTFTSANWTVAQIDGMTDAVAAQQQGWDLTLLSTGTQGPYLDVVGPFEGRWFFFTSKFMYPSDINDPDLVSTAVEGVRITAGNHEQFQWARAISSQVILVGTSNNVYILTGTFSTLADGSIDIYYLPLMVKYPPVNRFAAYYGGAVYYMSSDGLRSVDSSGNNPSYVVPSLQRLYEGESCQGYGAVNKSNTPICIVQNSIYVGAGSNTRVEVFDFTRNYWHPISTSAGLNAACESITGLPMFAMGTSVITLNDRTSSSSQTVNLLTGIFDFDSPGKRKDQYTIKLGIGGVGTVNINYGLDRTLLGSFTFLHSLTLNSTPQEVIFTFSPTLSKTTQLQITGTVTDFTLEYIIIEFDPRPEQLTYLRIPSTNFGVYGRKRIADQPFVIDTLGNGCTITAIVDGNALTSQTVTVTGKRTVSFQYSLNSYDFIDGVDYEFTLTGNPLFELYEMLPPRNMEVFPEPTQYLRLPNWNGGSGSKKRLRVWPIELDNRNANVLWTPIIDGTVLTSNTQTISANTLGRKTYLLQYPFDAFGTDYTGVLTSSGLFEFWKLLEPEIVQILPVAKRFDQLGPEELGRTGKVSAIELRVLAFGSPIPVTFYFHDGVVHKDSFQTINGVEDTYELNLPRNIVGKITRIELGPTTFDFHRYYIRLKISRTGSDTEKEWITIPAPPSPGS